MTIELKVGKLYRAYLKSFKNSDGQPYYISKSQIFWPAFSKKTSKRYFASFHELDTHEVFLYLGIKERVPEVGCLCYRILYKNQIYYIACYNDFEEVKW